MPSVAFDLDATGAKRGFEEISRGAKMMIRDMTAAQRAVDDLNRGLRVVQGGRSAGGSTIETQAVRQAEQLQRATDQRRRAEAEARRETERSNRGLLTLRSTLGGAERASSQMARAQQRLDAAVRAGLVDTREAARLQRLMAQRFTESAVRSRDLSTSMARLSRTGFDLRRAFFAVSAVLGAREIVTANVTFERITNALRAGLGSAQAAAEGFGFVRSEAQRLGLDLATSAEQFAKLSAAARGTTLEGAGARDIFAAIAESATVLGLSAEQTGGALTAIEQIISKGTVSAEELRGQLGERLPGAFQIAARSVGLTTGELDKLLKQGGLASEELLPRLARELRRTFGSEVERAAQSTVAQLNRLNTAVFDLKVQLGQSGAIDAFRDTVVTITDALKDPATQRGIEQLGSLFAKTAEISLKNLDALAAAAGALAGFRLGGPTGALVGGGLGALLASDRFSTIGEASDSELLRRLEQAQQRSSDDALHLANLIEPDQRSKLLEELTKRGLVGPPRPSDLGSESALRAVTGETLPPFTPSAGKGKPDEGPKRIQALEREIELLEQVDEFERQRAQARFSLEDSLAKATTIEESARAFERYELAVRAVDDAESEAAQTSARFAKAQKTFTDALEAAETPAERLATQVEEITKAYEDLKAAGVDVTEDDLTKAISSTANQVEKARTAQQEFEAAGTRSLQALSGGFQDLFTDLLTGTVDSSEAFERFAKRSVSALIDLAAQLVIVNGLASALNAVSSSGNLGTQVTGGSPGLGSLLGGILGGVLGLIGFEHGGIVTGPTLGLIGEAGHAETVLPFDIRQAGLGSQVVVNINQASGTEVDVEEGTDSRGRTTIDIAVNASVEKNIARGGNVLRGLTARSNVRPTPSKRT